MNLQLQCNSCPYPTSVSLTVYSAKLSLAYDFENQSSFRLEILAGINCDTTGTLSLAFLHLAFSLNINIRVPAVSQTRPNRARATQSGSDNTASDSVINAIRAVFPDGQYTLVNDTLASGNCPPGGRFHWEPVSAKLWAMDMAGQVHMRVHVSGSSQRALIADPALGKAGSHCLMYSSHQFDAGNAELLTELQAGKCRPGNAERCETYFACHRFDGFIMRAYLYKAAFYSQIHAFR